MNARFVAAVIAASRLVLFATDARAQEPVGPPPPGQGQSRVGLDVQELLPEIGRIGAEVGLFSGLAWNPYELGRGPQVGGYIDVPLARGRRGKVSYQLSIGLGRSTSEPFVVTDAVAYVANLASGASQQAALLGPPAAPFPVRRLVESHLRLLQVSPFGLKYAFSGLDRRRLRPYVTAGLDFAVVITNERPLQDESLAFTGTAPFDAPLLGGQIAQAPELSERRRPTGQGNIELGGHAGAGLEIRLSRGISLNGDYRFTALGSKDRLHAVTSALGFHW